MSALFSGTVHLVQMTYVPQGGSPTGTSMSDMQIILQYAQKCIVPITEMVEQLYGTTNTSISPTILTFTANMSGSTFGDGDLQGWVNQIVSDNNLPSDSMIVVTCPTASLDGDGTISQSGGYHNIANVPYAIVGVLQTPVTSNDQADQYQMGISHEIAEAIVDPKADHSNPEVGDPCCENCYGSSNFYRVYFDAHNDYLGTNQATPPGGFNFDYFMATVTKPAGTADCPAPDADCNYAPVPQNFYFVVDKSTFGRDEVNDTLSYPTSFWLILDGYSPNGLAGATPQLSGAFSSSNIPGLTITPHPPTFDLGSMGADGDIPQRIRFAYDIAFTMNSLNAFPAQGNPPLASELDASLQVPTPNSPLTAQTEFFLGAGNDPYFSNVSPNVGNEFYRSRDLRVFSANQASPAVISGPGTPPVMNNFTVSGAYDYIQSVITYLNQQIGYLNPNFTPPTNSDPLDSFLPAQGNALIADGSVTPTSGGDANFNFAIARVRLKGQSGMAGEAPNVKVFFRIFTSQTFDTDFIDQVSAVSMADPNITYPSVNTSDPQSPLPGTDGNGMVNGSSLPCFATNDFVAGPTDYNNNGPNNQTVIIPDNQTDTWAYFGCFLNVYDHNNLIGGQKPQVWLAGGTHHCLVAQIAFHDTPIRNVNGVIETPENSDKLAQRNLTMLPGGNPGFPATHRVPQMFDARPSPAPQSQDPLSVLAYPDEIMIDWGKVPVGSVATLYWPAVNSASVLQLAAQFYASHMLAAVDAHTIQCQVVGKVTYIPIPVGTGGSFAGLFTVDLPQGIKAGNEFNIVVRRITTRQLTTKTNPAPPVLQRHVKGGLVKLEQQAPKVLVWRYITGTFLFQIPIQKESLILPVDENLLAIFKWRLGLIGPHNRWTPVLERFIAYLVARILAMGGNPALIPPSANGYYNPSHGGHGGGHPGGHGGGHPGHPGGHGGGLGGGHGGHPGAHGCELHAYTGKVSDMVFDRFGDFEGFGLHTETCEERRFHAHESEMQALIYRAWTERFVITVFVEHEESHEVASVVLRRAPRALGD